MNIFRFFIVSIGFIGLAFGDETSYLSAKTKFIEVSGHKIAYRSVGVNKGVPLVLLMHTRGNMDGWDPILVDSLAQNRMVIAFDNKGVGFSEGKTPQSFADMANDAAQFIQSLKYKKVDILGFSIGGAVAQELLIRHNSLIRRAILAGTSASGGEGVNKLSEKSKAVSTKEKLTDEDILYAFFAQSEISQKLGRGYLERIQSRKSDLDKPVDLEAVKSQAVARESWGKSENKNDEVLKNVQNPILVVNGKDDIRMPTINSYSLFSLLPKAQLILYPDSGHGFLFQYPELCSKNFSDFLDQMEIK